MPPDGAGNLAYPFGPDAARARGTPVKTEVYRSLDQTVTYLIGGLRESRSDDVLARWAGQVIIAAGRPQGVSQQVQCIVDDFRRKTVYMPDPVGVERIAKPRVTLCLIDGAACIPVRDCDDGLLAVGGALMAVGILVQIVVQEFGPGAQPHVLLVFLDENHKWIYLDPGGNMPDSDPVTGLKVGQLGARPVKETWINPMDAQPRYGFPTTADPLLVGVGRVALRGDQIVSVIRARRTGFGVSGNLTPWTGGQLNPGDVIYGSYDFDQVNTALYPGPNPIDYLKDVLHPIFANATSYGLWSPGDPLPSFWPVDDAGAANEWHFRVFYEGPNTINLDLTNLLSGTSKMRLWRDRADPSYQPTTVLEPAGPAGPHAPQGPGPEKKPPRAQPDEDNFGLPGALALFGGGAIVVGIGWGIWRARNRRRKVS